jgi:hypothetical protein
MSGAGGGPVPQPWVVCRKCQHPGYNHEDSDLVLGRCRYWGCRCRGWKPLYVGPSDAERQEPPWEDLLNITGKNRRLGGQG